jgi:hypothetical protein
VLHYESISYGDQATKQQPNKCANDGRGCTGSGGNLASPGGSAVAMPVTASSSSTGSGSSSGGAGAKTALMVRGKAKFSGEWNDALTCTFLHK